MSKRMALIEERKNATKETRKTRRKRRKGKNREKKTTMMATIKSKKER